jgi:hypothetical protein
MATRSVRAADTSNDYDGNNEDKDEGNDPRYSDPSWRGVEGAVIRLHEQVPLNDGVCEQPRDRGPWQSSSG